MSRTLTTRLKRTGAFALVAASIAAPGASARPADDSLRAPSPTAAELRSDSAVKNTDLRMPDTRDAANGNVPAEVGLTSAGPKHDGGGFDWATAGLTAAVVVGMLSSAVIGIGVLRQRRRRAIA